MGIGGLTIAAGGILLPNFYLGLHSVGKNNSAKNPCPVMGPLSTYMSDAGKLILCLSEKIPPEKAKHLHFLGHSGSDDFRLRFASRENAR